MKQQGTKMMTHHRNGSQFLLARFPDQSRKGNFDLGKIYGNLVVRRHRRALEQRAQMGRNGAIAHGSQNEILGDGGNDTIAACSKTELATCPSRQPQYKGCDGFDGRSILSRECAFAMKNEKSLASRLSLAAADRPCTVGQGRHDTKRRHGWIDRTR